MGKTPKFLSSGLRSSLKPSSKDDLSQPMINILTVDRKEDEEEKMKTSGDTAADMNGSKANSTDKEDDKTINSVVFGGTTGLKRMPGLKLGLKKQAMNRKFSMPQTKELVSPLFTKKK